MRPEGAGNLSHRRGAAVFTFHLSLARAAGVFTGVPMGLVGISLLYRERYPRLSGADVGGSGFGAAAAIQGGGDDTASVAGTFTAGEEGL